MADIGYLLPTRETVMAGAPATGPLLALAERAEALGYRSLWVGDSLLARPRHEPLTLLAAVAARTSTAQLGTAVLLPALRNPVVLAHLAATVDLVSEGRLILGVGLAAGTNAARAEFAAAGVPFEARGARMVETLDVCRGLWSGEPLTRSGPLFPLEDAQLLPKPHRPAGPLIWAAGSGPIGRRRAAELYDGWFPIGADQANFAEGVAEVTALAAAAGRPRPTMTMYLTVAIDESARATAAVENFLAGYYGAPGPAMRAQQACATGPVDDVSDQIRSWVAAGADHIVLRFAGDHERHLELLADLANE